MLEKLKSIPMPIWIGLGLVVILVIFTSSKSSSSSSGGVTAGTVGTQGSQAGAGTDQELGNLSQITQSGFSQIMQNEQAILTGQAQIQSGQQTGFGQVVNLENANAASLSNIFATLGSVSGQVSDVQTGITGINTQVSSMQGFGALIQSLQNAFAQFAAAETAPTVNGVNNSFAAAPNSAMQVPSPTNSTPANTGGSSHPPTQQYTVSLPGGGNVTVNASSPDAARLNAGQETGFDTSSSSISLQH